MIIVKESADIYRAEAAERRRRSAESWERSDTDGCVTQYVADMTARQYDRAAQVAEEGGHEFPRLQRLDGTPVPAKLIKAKYGLCWALLKPNGRFTGEFVGAFPRRASTLERKGYREVYERVPAARCAVKISAPAGARGFSGLTSCYIEVVELEGETVPEGEWDERGE